MHQKNIQSAGRSLKEAAKVLIMIHGRGGDARDILSLASHLNAEDFALMAPEATNHTWYPNSFMAPVAQNEPWLSSALDNLKEMVDEVIEQGISAENIYFMGFSQGACLTLEFVTRNAKKYGGVAAFTGGLIGQEIDKSNYSGDFEGTPIFIGTGDPDPHVPVSRVNESAEILEKMGARVSVKIYEGRPHTISQDEIEQANTLVFNQ